MNEQLTNTLRGKKAFLELEGHLLKQAKRFYELGFHPGNLTSSQMAGISNRLQTASSPKEAQEKVSKFLNKQMEKLEAKDRQESWLKTAGGGAKKDPLGITLQKWIIEKKYLPADSVTGDLDHLAALRRFWSNVYGMYRYHKVCNEGMPLNEEELS